MSDNSEKQPQTIDDGQTGSSELEEIEFRQFINSLLRAQGYEFLNESDLFSNETLRQTMEKLCDIIAEEVKAESCTIHLKLYDPTELLSPAQSNNIRQTFQSDIETQLENRIKEVAANWGITNPGEKAAHHDQYREILASTMSFPYWRYPKGVARLFAANNGSPWVESRKGTDPQNDASTGTSPETPKNPESAPRQMTVPDDKNFVSLESGITADIFQDNFAKIRDPLSIRSSRQMRKLGGVDYLVWKNGNWRQSFKNFYGSPIRIHPTGEVIGILKVENKHGRRKQDEPDEIENEVEQILSKFADIANHNAKDLNTFELQILKFATSKHEDPKASYREISLLALAYLSADLASCVQVGKLSDSVTLRDLVFIPYPHPEERQGRESAKTEDRERTLDQWRQLKACVDENPIIQIMAKNIDQEAKLWQMLTPNTNTGPLENDQGRGDLEKAFLKKQEFYLNVRQFYRELSEYFQQLKYDKPALVLETPKLNNARVEISELTAWCGATTGVSQAAKSDLEHFYFEATVKAKDGSEVVLYILSPPAGYGGEDMRAAGVETKSNISEMDRMLVARDQPCTHCNKLAAIYKELYQLNPEDDPLDQEHRTKFHGFTPERNGEWLSLRLGEAEEARSTHSHSVIDLLVDRWAARIEALNYCFPVREFSQDDTKKLCWAALEIGKLIEREISYRANRSVDPIPLTAMEFFRIPISDLCFVDDLQKRRADAKKVNVHIDYRIQNTLYTMQMQDAVRFESRVKYHRSHLARLGERHEGFVRGNLAIWLYLLALTGPIKKCAEPPSPEKLNDFDKFQRNLVTLRASIDKAYSNEDHSNLIDGTWFENNGDSLIGDTRFVSPPLLEFERASKVKLTKYLKTVCLNLMNECFAIKSTASGGIDPYCPLSDKAQDNLIFRQYDPYAIAATSLLCQLKNMIKFPKSYLEFYEKCFNLRNFLAESKREIEDNPNFEQLAEVFRQKGAGGGVIWSELMEYVEMHDTDQFLQLLNVPPERKLYINPGGIYKRIRNLNHTLNQQRGLAHLDWELGRFDLLGCRLNCLYKNQVFAAFEQLWNSGDPFWGMVTKQMERRPVPHKKFFQVRSDDRQRWLCVRTKNFEDNYYALQIAALVDPNAIHEGFWDKEKTGYNLRRVQTLLGRLFDEFDPTGAKEYKSLAWKRQHLRWEYVDWYKIASELVRTKSVPVRQEDDAIIGFGSFLGEAAVDFLMECIDECRFDKDAGRSLDVAKKAFRVLKPLLTCMLAHGESYTAEILKSLHTTDENPTKTFTIRGDFVPAFYSAINGLYGGLKKMVMRRRSVSEAGINDRRHEAWLCIAKKESDYYLDQFENQGQGAICSSVPIIFVPDNKDSLDSAEESYAEKLRQIDLDSNAISSEAALNALYGVLTSLRREQKRFLFYSASSDVAAKRGLAIRDKESVLHRIQNYVLLYDRNKPPRGFKKQGARFKGWTSYGLFYYLRSLIPLEIQIRTTLADTLAEQYHDAIYKGAPPTGTEFPRKQMEKIAGDLDNLDKEMEIDFEDYINRRYFLSKLK